MLCVCVCEWVNLHVCECFTMCVCVCGWDAWVCSVCAAVCFSGSSSCSVSNTQRRQRFSSEVAQFCRDPSVPSARHSSVTNGSENTTTAFRLIILPLFSQREVKSWDMIICFIFLQTAIWFTSSPRWFKESECAISHICSCVDGERVLEELSRYRCYRCFHAQS